MSKGAYVFLGGDDTDRSESQCELCQDTYPVIGSDPTLELLKGDKKLSLGYICPECIELGPQGAAERVLEHAGYLQRQAKLFHEAAAIMKRMKSWYPEQRSKGKAA